MCLTNVNDWLGVFIALIILIAFLVFCVVIGVLNIKTNAFFSYLNKVYKICLLFFVTMCIFGGIFSGAVKIKENRIIDIQEEVTYSGKITTSSQKDNYVVLELKNVNYIINGQTKKLNSNLKLYVYTINAEGLDVGNIVSTTGKINRYEIKSYAYYNYSALYSANANLTDLTIKESKPSFIESIKLKTNEILNKYMNTENAKIAFSVLFGDKEDLNEDISNAFSIAGISHILAVSGLHIGILVSILLFVFKKLKFKKIATILVLTFILIFYMTLCNFTPSVVRSSIMALVLVLSNMLGKRYDALSSLCLAGLIIVVFNPFQMLSCGFQLSFACVFAIITLAPTLTNMLVKLKINKKISQTLAISTATSIALIPFSAYYFHRITLLSVITNIFVIPVFSVAYIFIFSLTILSLIFSFVGYLLVIPNVLIHFIKIIANFVASLKFNTIVVFDVGVIGFVSILGLQYVLQFMVGMPKLKMVLVAFLFVVFISSMTYNCIPYTYKLNSVVCFKQYNDNMVLTTHNSGETTLIGLSSDDYNKLNYMLINYRINKIDNIIIYENIEDVEFINKIVDEYKVKNIYMPNQYFKENILNAISIFENNQFEINNIKYNFVYNNGKILGVNYIRYGLNNFIGNSVTKNEFVTISNILGYNINLISVKDVTFDLATIINYNVLITQNDGNYETINLDSNQYFISYI